MVLMKYKCHKATLRRMNSQRHDGTLCDLKIRVGDGHIIAHKAVLAACSPYFHTMFTGGFREADSPVTEMDMSAVFSNPSTADHIIQSMYTGQLELTPSNICAMYSICSFLLYEKAKVLCETFMTTTLSLENGVEFWEASFYHNPSGKLHSSATALLKNRFHDFFIYQDLLLHATVSTVTGLLKTEITSFCSTGQIIRFLVEWFLRTDTMEADILRQLVIDAHLRPADYEHIIDTIRFTVLKRTTNRQETGNIVRVICEGLGLGTSEMDIIQDEGEPSNCMMEGRKQIPQTNLKQCRKDNGDPMRLEQHQNQQNGTANDKRREEPLVRDASLRRSEKEYHHVSVNLSAASSASELEVLMQDVSSKHPSGKLLEKQEKLDVLLALAPSFTTVDEDINEYGQLRLLAYVPVSKHWVDLGVIDYPTVDSDGDTIRLTKSALYVAGGYAYIHDSGKNLFSMHIPSGQWKRIVLPNQDRDISVYPLCVEDHLYLTIFDDAEDSAVPPPDKKPKHHVRPTVNLMFGSITDGEIWEDIVRFQDNLKTTEQPKQATNIIYGPCWGERSCCLVKKQAIRHGRNIASGVFCFDPQNKDMRFIPFEGKPGVIVKMDNWPGDRETHTVQLDNWTYLWQYPGSCSINRPSPAITLRFRTSEDKSSGLLEKRYIKFPNASNISGKIPSLPVLNDEAPESSVVTTMGSSVWCFQNTSTTQSCLQEFNIKIPDVLIDHPPPPCNVTLAVTGATLDSTVLAEALLAHYSQVQFPQPVKGVSPLMSDSETSDDTSDSDCTTDTEDSDDYYGYLF